MTIETYLWCAFSAFLGWVLYSLLKLRSLKQKAMLANVEFKPIEYFKDDWLSTLASFVTVVICLVSADEFINFSARVIDYMKIGFAFVGYTGSDIMSRLFSVVNMKINKAIDYKTTIADQVNGTLDKPTPK